MALRKWQAKLKYNGLGQHPSSVASAPAEGLTAACSLRTGFAQFVEDLQLLLEDQLSQSCKQSAGQASPEQRHHLCKRLLTSHQAGHPVFLLEVHLQVWKAVSRSQGQEFCYFARHATAAHQQAESRLRPLVVHIERSLLPR